MIKKVGEKCERKNLYKKPKNIFREVRAKWKQKKCVREDVEVEVSVESEM